MRRIVLNTSGQTPETPTGLPMMDYRLPLEGLVRGSGLAHVILRPTAYLQNLLGPWARPGVVEGNVLAYPVPETHRVSWIAAEDLGRLAVAALTDETVSGTFDVGGPEALTGPQMVQTMSRVLGREIRYHALPPEEFGAMMGRAFGQPELGEQAARAYRLTWDGDPDAMVIEMAPVLRALPVQLTTFEDWMRAHARAFQAGQPGAGAR